MSKFHKSLIEEGLNLRKNWKGGRHFCVVASPKSASYFTAAVISKYLSVPQVSYNEEKSREISIEKALSLSGRDSVVHLHSLPDNDMYRIITCIGILPIILTRDLADTIVSLNDHDIKRDIVPSNARKSQLSKDDQLRLTAYQWLNWLATFQRDWVHVKANREMLIIDYEDITQKSIQTFKKILEYWRIDINDQKLKDTVTDIKRDLGAVGFNKGVSGRGRYLPDDVGGMISFYRDYMELTL